jgi:hypothetical protein
MPWIPEKPWVNINPYRTIALPILPIPPLIPKKLRKIVKKDNKNAL